jgi:MoaA/NifB/PqqE/SkfB family radical SAM enzyme
MNKICLAPFLSAELRPNGDLNVCCFGKDHPKLEGDTIIEKYNSASAELIRESILDGSYRFCDENICPYMKNEDERYFLSRDFVLQSAKPHPRIIHFGDEVCNLACPSCREDFILEDKHDIKYYDEIMSFGAGIFALSTSNNGDPLYSKNTVDFLKKVTRENFPNLNKVNILTNGILVKTRWDILKRLNENFNLDLSISIDAAKSETYSEVRRGGNFKTVIENLKFLNDQKIKKLGLNFTVNSLNYSEMIHFYELIEGICPDIETHYVYTKIQQWWQDDELFLTMLPLGVEFDEAVTVFKEYFKTEIEDKKVLHNL